MDNEILLTTLRDLHEKKKSGELDEHEETFLNETKWRDEIDYEILESCLEHSSEKIRLTALGLLVDSRKTTLYFVHKELELIAHFLLNNLGERIEFMPSIKKSLKRVKDSLVVIQRNAIQLGKFDICKGQLTDRINIFEKIKEEVVPIVDESIQHMINYQKFYVKIRSICLTGITPGSTHTKKKNSLRILQLLQEFLSKFFDKSKWAADQANKLYQCLLLDTYEINKQVAYEILKNLEPNLLKLDDEKKLTEIINVALQLANSIRPIDSVTASYMLKLCLLSPVLKNVLKNYLKSDDFNHQDPDYLTLQMIIIVMDKLRGPAELASENIITAAAKHSLYGYLHCIKILISICDLKNKKESKLWKRIINDIITLCLSLNESVSQIVNNSSPEGHFPMDLENKNLAFDPEESELVSVTPQMVLLCSWRTVKEVSLLFGYMTENLPIEEIYLPVEEENSGIEGENTPIEGGNLLIKEENLVTEGEKLPIKGEILTPGLLTEEQIIRIGDHLVTMLCETKHRGAFEQAHVGFEQICRRLWSLKQSSLNRLPKIWLFQLLLAIAGLAPGNTKLCATRRSAGVPFMVQAIVASEPSVRKKREATVFHTTIKILFGMTQIVDEIELWATSWELISTDPFFFDIQNENSTPIILTTEDSICNVTLSELKTHALNILRALFKHAQLGDLTKNYASQGLIAAIKSYDEKTWAERNAATLLYSAMIIRIFGVQRTKDHVNLTVHNKMTVKIFFDKFTKLSEYMMIELDNFVMENTLIKPSVQSILLLLSRLYLSINSELSSDINLKIDKFIKLISLCAKSRVYKTRELAARALVPFLTVNTIEQFVIDLFAKMTHFNNVKNLNIMHGYMLQLLEITKTGILTSAELSKIDLELFLSHSSWILENLEIHNNKPACFPLASVYIESLHELLFIRNYLDNPIIFNKFFTRLLSHTGTEAVLKKRPGKEIYEAAAAKLLITLMEVGAKDEVVLDKLLDAWTGLLTYDNCEAQITGWMSIIFAIHQTSDEKLLHTAINCALKNLRKHEIIDPDLQSIVYEFLYDVFVANETNREPFKSWDNFKSLSKAILIVFTEKMPDECASLFKLLGKVFGKLMKEKIYLELIENLDHKVYEMFCDNSWTGSAVSDCRLAIASVVHDIYFDIRKTKRKLMCATSLDWWTTVLNLLVDDNSEVRKLAAIAIAKVEPINETKCNSSSLKIFFKKFSKRFYDYAGSAFAAYFLWSLELSGDNYEMDESDVFNKSYNYETFEPLTVSDLCGEYLITLHDRLNINSAFSADIQSWLSRRLNIPCSQCTDPRTLIKFYHQRLPSFNRNLIDILDPMYNDKLLQDHAFKKFNVLANEKS